MTETQRTALLIRQEGTHLLCRFVPVHNKYLIQGLVGGENVEQKLRQSGLLMAECAIRKVDKSCFQTAQVDDIVTPVFLDSSKMQPGGGSTEPSLSWINSSTTVVSSIVFSVETAQKPMDPLLQTCLKRLVMGSIVLHIPQEQIFTTLQVRVNQQTYKLTVASLTCKAQLVRILPSTRITFIVHDPKKPPNATLDRTKLTSTALYLADTLECLKIAASNESFSADVPRSILLSGNPGVGKTHAVRSVCPNVVSVQGSELLGQSDHPADAAADLEGIFLRAAESANKITVIFLDECDALFAGQLSFSSMVMEAMLRHLLDRTAHEWRNLVVVAATNRIDALPEALRGKWGKEIVLRPPNEKERLEILAKLFPPAASATKIAKLTMGYVAADLAALVRRAQLLNILQHKESAGNSEAPQSDVESLLLQAMKDVPASARRNALLVDGSQQHSDDIAGDPGGVKKMLLRHTQDYGGILLHGPPGCAKTSLARAAARDRPFVSLSPADVFATSYVGDAEAVVRSAFDLARSLQPCILFFDEIDAIVGSESSSRGDAVQARVLSTFLNEMDGVDVSQSNDILVLAATNRPWTLDSALLRPGRFDKIVHVPAPDVDTKVALLLKHGVSDAELIAKTETNHMTGAEIVGACREAALECWREGELALSDEAVVSALRAVHPLLADEKVRKEYESFGRKTRARLF